MALLISSRKEAEVRALLPRWRAATKAALRYMDALHYSVRGLARLLRVDSTSLGRFLSGDMDSAPCSSRPAMLRILEKVERICELPEDVTEIPLDELPSTDDEGLWVRYHTLALRGLRRLQDPSQGLGEHMAVLAAQAVHGPSVYRPHMCTHVLLTIMHVLFRLSGEVSHSCSRDRIRSTVRRIDRLEGTALDGAAHGKGSFRSPRAVGYAASGRGYAGILLDDTLLIEAGTRGMLRAAACPHIARIDKLWPNALLFVEKLLERRYPGAVNWARRAFELANADRSEGLFRTLGEKQLPRLVEVWKRMNFDFARSPSDQEIQR